MSGPRCSWSGSRAGRATWRPTTPSPTPRPRSAARSARSPRRPRASASASSCRCTPRVADKFAILRSLSHTGFCHQQGNQQMFTGHPEQVLKLKPDHPDLFCIAHRERADPGRRVPDLRRREPDPLPRLGLPRPGVRAVRRPRRPERAGLQRPGDRPERTPPRSPGWSGRMGLAKRFDGLRRAIRRPDAVGGLRRLPAAGVHAPDRPRGQAGVRPRAGKTRGSATATAGTPGASAACWPGGWSRRAWTS